MSNNKQSSQIWLSSQLFELFEQYIDGNYDRQRLQDLMVKTTEQAEEMHKEEHSNTWDESVDNYKKRGENDMRHWVDFDYYYNETFGGNK